MSQETADHPLADGGRDQVTRRARQLWQLLEPVHGVVYFAPEARARFEEAGLKGFWMGYFASRSAALGPVGPDLVVATFYVFNPGMVARALPDAWDLASPEAVLDARSELADTTLRSVLGDLAIGPDVETAAELAASIARTAPRAGHPLGAAHERDRSAGVRDLRDPSGTRSPAPPFRCMSRAAPLKKKGLLSRIRGSK